MKREEYNSCIADGMRGQTFTKEERKLEFCILAKTCSGNSSSREEAKAICLQPKPPKKLTTSKRAKFCNIRDLDTVATCTASKIDLSKLTQENIHEVFANALKECSGVKSVKLKTAKKTIEDFNPEERETLKTIALLSKQSEGRVW